MSAIDLVLPRLKVEEGFEPKKYVDIEGFLTIGYGFNVDAGISEFSASALLAAQAQEIHDALMAYPWYAGLDSVRQSVCLDICFNEYGPAVQHFISGWPHLIAALSAQDWAGAQAQCHTSTLEDQSRYTALGTILLTGVV